MKQFLYLIKLTAFIVIWIINVDAGDKTEWWIELINHNGTITKVKRSEYLEYNEMLELNIPDERLDWNNYFLFEKDYQEEFEKPIESQALDGKLYHLKYKAIVEGIIKLKENERTIYII